MPSLAVADLMVLVVYRCEASNSCAFHTPTRSVNAASRACVRWHRWYLSRNISTSVILGNLYFDQDVGEGGELKHTAELVHVAFHIHDSVRNDDVGKPCP
jgi:hypothetical protein